MYKKQHIHFVGIGGIGMSGIAEVLLNLGYPVSGSDVKRSQITRRLQKKGARIYCGHKREQVLKSDIVVVSSAIQKNNVEILEAQKQNIQIVQRAEMLAELMRFSKYGIAVSGTHGKTTTTSLIASILYEGGYDPTMIIGGRVNSFKSNARLGRGDFMVAEADESDGSFLKLSPTIIVVTSIDKEHMDYYSTFDHVKSAYLEFVGKVPFYGVAVCCVDHPVIRRLIPQMGNRVISYGLSKDAVYSAADIKNEGGQTSYDLLVRKEKREHITLSLIGQHNILNSLAAIAVADELGVPIRKIQLALKRFKGIQRRCEVLLRSPAITVIDDYGHHPEEIKATLQAIRSSFAGRLVTLFQPHRYSRTKALFAEFKGAFDRTNLLLITDIYAAGEVPLNGVHSKKLVRSLKKKHGKNVIYFPKDHKLVNAVLKIIQPGDVLLSLGAGDITQIGRECARKLKDFAIEH